MSTSPLFPDPPKETPQLRLWSPAAGDHGSPGPTADMTLEEFFGALVRPVRLGGSASRTIDEYVQSLRYWRTLTDNRPLGQIDDLEGAAFLAGLRALPGRDSPTMGENTVRKHCTHVQMVLDMAGPKTRQRRQAAGLLPQGPPVLVKPAQVDADVDDNFSLAEVGWWLECMRHARRPKPRDSGVEPATWWRSLGLLDYNTGLRIGTVLLLRREWLEEDELGHWFKIPPWAMKRRRRGFRCYLNAHALAALRAMGSVAPDPGPESIFVWPHTINWLEDVLGQYLAKSRIAENRRFKFHALRKAFATELAKINGLIVPMAMAHSLGRNVTLGSYVHRKAMTEAMDRLPQPVWASEPDRQGRLF